MSSPAMGSSVNIRQQYVGYVESQDWVVADKAGKGGSKSSPKIIERAVTLGPEHLRENSVMKGGGTRPVFEPRSIKSKVDYGKIVGTV